MDGRTIGLREEWEAIKLVQLLCFLSSIKAKQAIIDEHISKLISLPSNSFLNTLTLLERKIIDSDFSKAERPGGTHV